MPVYAMRTNSSVDNVSCRRLMTLLTAWLALVALCWWQATSTTLESLETALQKKLPQRLAAARVNQVGHHELTDYLKSRIEADLANIRPGGQLSLVKSCSVRVLRLQDKFFPRHQSNKQAIFLKWQYNGHDEEAVLAVECAMHWPRLLGSQLLVALAGWLLIGAIPAPLSQRRRAVVNRLVSSGLSPSRARHLTRHLDSYNPMQLELAELLLSAGDIPAQGVMAWLETPRLANLDSARLPWLILGLKHQGHSMEQALQIAEADPALELNPDDCTARCHGVAVPLPSTPFFYYYWYALRRSSGENAGWFTNPPANGCDTQVAQELIALMERHGGHHRAVKDLRDKGLRAKILDQNRSKIKDEMINALGETLASEYLFEMARDPRTARYNYRLALPPERIRQL